LRRGSSLELEKRDEKQLYALNIHDIQTIYRVKEQLLEHLETPPIIKELAVSANMSPSKLKRLFKQVFGNSIFSYYQGFRMQEAARLLKEEKLSVLTLPLPREIKELVTGLLQREQSKRIDSAETALKILGTSDGEIKYNSFARRILRKKKLIIPSLLFLVVLIFILKYYISQSIVPPKQNLQTVSASPLITGTNDKIKNETPVNSKETKKEDVKPTVGLPPVVDKDLSIDKTTKIVQNAALKKKGSLFVECLPWAYVYVDSLKIDITPLKNNINLDEGEHIVRLYNPNYPSYSRKILISGSSLTNIKINLDTLFGYFDCKVFPWCEIYVDGKMTGQTPLQSPVRLIPGEHHIVLKNPEFTPVEYKIRINQNQTYTLKYSFTNVN